MQRPAQEGAARPDQRAARVEADSQADAGAAPEQESERATALHLAVRRTARIVLLGQRRDATSVWLACHGYGQLAQRFIRRLEPIATPGRLIIAPEALNRYYLDAGHGPHGPDARVGATWMTREDRLSDIDDYIAYLDVVLAEIAPDPLPPLVALGFSQGVATICRWAARTDRPIRDLILWSGFLPPELAPSAALFGSARLTLAYGRDDRFADARRIDAQSEALRNAGLPHRIVRYDGGHDIDADALRGVAQDLESAG